MVVSRRPYLGIEPELLGELHKDLRVCTLFAYVRNEDVADIESLTMVIL